MLELVVGVKDRVRVLGEGIQCFFLHNTLSELKR